MLGSSGFEERGLYVPPSAPTIPLSPSKYLIFSVGKSKKCPVTLTFGPQTPPEQWRLVTAFHRSDASSTRPSFDPSVR